jgi:Reverse transcriptase (RNA-dependent DNA polymerase)
VDHLPIITVINLPLPRSTIPPTLDFQNADWPKINTLLKAKLEAESPAVRIRTQDQFISKVDQLIDIITDVLHENLDELKPSPFSRRWWTKELTELKKEQNRLSNKLYRLRDVRNHPIHVEFRASINKFKEIMIETCKQHWIDWLESIEQQEIYTANKYLVSKPTDYSSARIPMLRTNINGIEGIAEDNETKAKELAKSFFPPPPDTSSVPPNHEYPTPLKGIRFYSRARIQQVFKTFSPYKAPGQDKIPNVVYIKCMDALIDHLFFIYRAIFKLNTYHPRWLELLTLVLRKTGKTDYSIAKAYRPIGLIDTLPKGFSALNSKQISFLAEKHNMLLVAHRIKDTWRSKKVVAALFLDVQGAFPNTVKDQLIHNMKMRHVPKCFTDLANRMLSGRSTRLCFDDYISDPIPLENSTMQGDPSSMLYYSFYNAPLLETAKDRDELSPGFVDDSMMLAIGNNLAECHEKLKDMMERPGGGFEWSRTHNSPFKISKIVLMNFLHSHRDTPPGDLILDRPNADGSVSTSSMKAVDSYKYLGVIFDPGLRWTLHHAKVIASATFWSSQIWRVSKTASGMSATGVRQLYNTVAVPGFTYGAEVWYTSLFKLGGVGNTKGSVATTNKLKSIQRKVAVTITGALCTTAGDTLDAHTNILPVDLLFNKVLFRAAAHLCSLPHTHPLHNIMHTATRRKVKHHRLPIHNLLFLFPHKPSDIEIVKAVRRRPNYQPSFDQFICDTKDDAFTMATLSHDNCLYKVYSDGSGY